MHVIDVSDPGYERQMIVTDEVLTEIGAKGVPRVQVFNKIDAVGDVGAQRSLEASLRERYPDCIVMSAKREGDIKTLRGAILAFFQRDLVEATLYLPWLDQQARGEIFATCEVLEESADEEGAILQVRGERGTVERLRTRFGRRT